MRSSWSVLVAGLVLSTFFPAAPCRATGDHPSIGITPATLTPIRDRIASDPVVGDWMAGVRDDAEAFLAGSSACSGFDSEADISRAAMTMAFVMAVDDDARFAGSVASLLACPGFFNGDDRDTFGWGWGGDLLRYGFAYDWAEPYLDSSQDSAARTAMLDAMGITMTAFERPPTTGSDPLKYYTNVRMRIGAGMGVAAMALRDDAGAAAWLDYIVEDLFSDAHEVAYYLDIVLTPDGTYNEGPSYQNDSFNAFLPFLLAYRDLSGIDLTGDYGTPGTGVWSDSRVRKMFATNLCMMTPERLPPTIDTGWRYGVDYHELIIPLLAEPEKSETQWYWEEAVGGPGITIAAILWADPNVAAAAPAWTSCRTSDYAVLRSGWGEEDIFVMVQSDHLPARSSHVQPDQTSFLMFAEGQYVLIDPGDGRDYGGSAPEHAWLRYNPACHNLVVVDGREAPGFGSGETTPARVHSNTDVIDPAGQDAFFLSDMLDLVTVTLGYENAPDVSLKRTVALARKRYVVVGDDLSASSSHAYEALLHYGGPAPDGAARIEGTLSTSSAAASWRTTNAAGQAIALEATWFPAPETIASADDGKTDYEPGVTFDHSYTRAHYTDGSLRFLNVIDVVNVDADEAALSPAALESTGGTALEAAGAWGRDIWLFAAAAGSEVQVASEDLSASSSFACLQMDAAANLLQAAAVDATAVALGGSTLAAAGNPVSFRLVPGPDLVTGETWAAAGTVFTVGTAFEPVTVLVDGAEAGFTWDSVSSAVVFDIPAGGSTFVVSSGTIPVEEAVEEVADTPSPEDAGEHAPDTVTDAPSDPAADGGDEGPGKTSGGCSCRIP